jgi:predicted amidophosphoribosyltransferase
LIKYKWRCDYCGNTQSQEKLITDECEHCGRTLQTMYCEHCKREFKL